MTAVLTVSLAAASLTANAGPSPTAAPAARVMERLDRGLTAVPTSDGAFLSWRLLGPEQGSGIGFNVYKNSTKLNPTPLTGGTNFTDRTAGSGTYTVRAVVDGKEQVASPPATVFGNGYGNIPLASIPGAAAADYYVQHGWPGDLDGDGRYEVVVSRLPFAAGRPSYLEAYSLSGARLWRVDLGPASYTRLGGNGANEPAPAAISGYGDVAGFRNDDNVTVYDLDLDGRAEVLVHTANGVRFADGRTVSAPAANQFVSVIDGRTGAERARAAVPTDLVANGPSGGHFGVGYLDGVRPSLITKMVNRTGAGTGGFNTLYVAWDYDGSRLTQRWKMINNACCSFHQIRIVDVDGDGRDDIADGNKVINSNGTLRYVVPGSIHGDRFHIGDLDPSRPGLEGYAIQQTEGGSSSTFPWYYYDAATGQRLVTGAHSGTSTDVARGTTADIDPGHPGYEYWATVASGEPGAGLFNVRGQRISNRTPSVNFRIWWDGDLGSELLDNTYVEKWNPGSQSVGRIFNPSGVRSSWRAAVPMYGDIIGDWREEILAETTDHTAMRIYTTTAPTSTRLYTLAHNPAYRLGFTVRGYLQSLLVDYYLGTGMSQPPAPNITTVGGDATPEWAMVASDDFRDGTGKWTAELESGGTVQARDGALDIDVPGGATVWFRQKFAGPTIIEYTATPVSAGGANDRVSDLNAFWSATDARSPNDLFASRRSGRLADYDNLKTYYVGHGANGNTTTRMRRYVGEPGNRPLIFDRTEPLLTANRPQRIRLVSDGGKIQYWVDGRLVFDYADSQPYTQGWFGFRTVDSHFTLRDFAVWQPRSTTPPDTTTQTPPTTTSPTTTTTATTTPTTGPGGTCSAAYRTTNAWPDGFQGEVTVTAGASAINGWTVGWTSSSGQSITQLWNGTLNVDGSTVSVGNLSYNGALSPSGSTTFGYTATGNPSTPALTCTTR
ncbi:rhamnogalacturonan endolyase [Saccharothrix ecbatanensis]|uniref:Rhamnogalacturonan endolyase n=1 Tax=Saccharothrix ecbatanensis TaxID=1105145 RepID=A0A7W9HVS9_9PSEU|nr:DUF6250 domain-containing protein [Saccharothrix ecbatanensis]MBB5808913.1 rhamnogalacturonan endolyase [Saccharothrix ecbatanensis]